MAEKVANIAKNTSYFTLALVLQKVISFGYFVILARALGPDDLGKYYFAVSFTSIFAIFIDLGLANYITREMARENFDRARVFGASLGAKIPLSLLTVAAAVVAVNFFGYPEITRNLVYLASVSMVLDSFSLLFFSAIRGFHNLSYESVGSVIFQLLILAVGGTAVFFHADLIRIMLGLTSASVFYAIYSAWVCVKFGMSLKPIFDFQLIGSVFAAAIPFGFYAIFQRAYTYFDSVLLSLMAGDEQVGLYQVAFKIVFALQFLPMAFAASLYPAMSLYWQTNREQLAVSFERALKYLIVISLPISAGIFILADKIILILNEDYLGAVLPLRIAIASLVFLFATFPVGSLLNACDRQKINTVNMGIVLIASVVSNLVLIPKFGATGASIAVAATNFLMFALGMIWSAKIIDFRVGKTLWIFFRALAVSSLMAWGCYWLKDKIDIFLIIPPAALFYFIFLFLIRGFTLEDLKSVFNSFGNKKTA